MNSWERESVGQAWPFETLKPTQVTPFLKQGPIYPQKSHYLLTLLRSITPWWPSIQMYEPMGAIFIWTTTSPNIIQKSKVSSETQGSLLTVIPCIIKRNYILPNTRCHRENILSSKEKIDLKQYSNPAMQTSNPTAPCSVSGVLMDHLGLQNTLSLSD